MDPLTHIVAGGLAGQAVRRRLPGKAIVPYAMLAAWIPDIDNFVSGDPEFYLLYHRAVTHSLFGGLLLALLPATAAWAFRRRVWPFGRLFAFTYGCVLLHIFLDWINNYGTQVLAPFTDQRFALGSVFIIDPILTGTLLLLFAATLVTVPARKPLVAGVALGFALLYPFANHGVKSILEARIAASLRAEEVAFQSVRLDTDFLTPFRWKLLTATEDEYLVEPFFLLGRGEPETVRAYRRADPDKLRALGEQESFFATWEWFADAIVVSESERGGNRVLLFSDLRFRSLHPWARRIQPADRPPPFSLEAELDAAGNLIDWRYYGPTFGGFED